MRKRYIGFLLIAFLACLLLFRFACNDKEALGAGFPLQRGVIMTEKPIFSPITKKECCGFRVKWEAKKGHGEKKKPYYPKGRVPAYFAHESYLQIADNQYQIEGRGGNLAHTLTTDWWVWNRDMDGVIAEEDFPAQLWGLDTRLDEMMTWISLGEFEKVGAQLIISEEIIKCGSKISLKGKLSDKKVEVYCHRCE